MWYWLRRPFVLLLVAAILVGAIAFYWMRTSPTKAGAAERSNHPTYRQQLDETIRQVERGM